MYGTSLEVTETNMQNNRANSGDDDCCMCPFDIWGPKTFFFFFFSTDCTLYGERTIIFSVPVPEDHSNMSLADYLPPGASSNPNSRYDLTTTIIIPGVPSKSFTTMYADQN